MWRLTGKPEAGTNGRVHHPSFGLRSDHDPGADDIYLTLDGRKFWPPNESKKVIDKDEQFSVNMTFDKWHKGRTFGIWEEDEGDDDFLGEIAINPSNFDGKFNVSMFSALHHSVYRVTFTLEK